MLSGDTSPTQATIDACHGCDALIHEVAPLEWLATPPATFQAFAAKYHTTTKQLAALANQAKPRLLILNHHSSTSPDKLVSEMMSLYSGHFVVGRDLDVY